MAATVKWQHACTSTGDFTDIGAGTPGLRFKNANNKTIDTNDPMVRPTAGTDYSFEKSTRINVTGTFTQLSNLKLDTSNPSPLTTGIDCYYGFIGTWATPVGTNSTIATTSLTTEVSWANAGTITTATATWGDYCYFQIDVGTNAPGGKLTSFQIIARYDEI